MHTIPSGLVIVNKHCEHFSLADSLLLLVVFCLVGFLSFFFSCPPQKTTPNRNELRWNEQKYAKDYDREEKHLYAVFNPLTITILHNLSLFDVTTLYKNCFPFFKVSRLGFWVCKCSLPSPILSEWVFSPFCCRTSTSKELWLSDLEWMAENR